MSEPIERDENRFKYLSNEPPAVIPEGVGMALEIKTTTELMGERAAWFARTKRCDCCNGTGRVPIDPEGTGARVGGRQA